MKIAIVGGGIAGLVGGFNAAEAGHKVTLFEQGRLGDGASGKALGVLVPITGLDRPIDKLQQAGIADWPRLAQRLAEVSGVVVADFWRDWEGGRQQVRLPMIFDVLKAAIERLGGEVKEGCRIDSPTLLRKDFDRVVLAGGLGNSTLCGAEMKVSAGVAARFRVSGYRDVGMSGLIAGDNLFVCPDWDGSVVAGSVNWDMPIAGDGVVPDNKLAELVQRVGALVPGLELVEAWVGYRPVQVPRLPLLREVGDSVFAVVGLGKVGIGVSPMLRFYE